MNNPTWFNYSAMQQPRLRDAGGSPGHDPVCFYRPINFRFPYRGLRWGLLDSRDGTVHTVLLFVDGSTQDNGYSWAKSGVGIVISPEYDTNHPSADQPGALFFPLTCGPFTSQRAELSASLAALKIKDWTEEGFKSIVIATDSSYVFNGAINWAMNWRRNDWYLPNGEKAKNIDLWERLLDTIDQLEARGVAVKFYLIERQFNRADRAAKYGAAGMYSSSLSQSRVMMARLQALEI